MTYLATVLAGVEVEARVEALLPVALDHPEVVGTVSAITKKTINTWEASLIGSSQLLICMLKHLNSSY